jgi:hypothetical protein
MIELDNKFEVGERVFVPIQEHIGEDCSLCSGTGIVKVENSDYTVKCPKCHGNKNYGKTYQWTTKEGSIHLLKLQYSKSMLECENVNKIRYIVHFNNEFNMSRERAEQNIFKTIEECQTECDRLNSLKK